MIQASFALQHHQVVTLPVERLVVTTFADGTEAHACPHDTADYREHSRRSGAGDDVDRYCLEHDLAHVWFGEHVVGGESPVLRHVASGSEFPTEQLDAEEEITKLLQRYWNRYGWPAWLFAEFLGRDWLVGISPTRLPGLPDR